METAKSLDAQDISLTQQTTSLEDRRCSALSTGYLRNGIGKWRKITSVVRIEQFTFTIRTNRYVCGNGLESALKAGRLFDFKCRIFIICQFIIYFYVVDLSQHRSFRCQTRNEAINIGRLPLNQNFHPTGRVAYPAMQIESDCQPVHKRTEPYSLHNTFN